MRNNPLAVIRKLLAPSLLIACNLFLFGSFTIYQGSPAEFDFGFLQLLGLFLLPLLATAAFLVALGYLFQKRLATYVAGLFCLGLLLWLQGTFLIWDYGVFDGRGIDWQGFSWQGWLDLSVWVVLLGIGLTFSAPVARGATALSWGLLLLQCVPVAIQTLTAADPLWTRAYRPQTSIPQGILRYSSRHNIIHVVLDSFQTDVFQEIVDEEKLQAKLPGFILFAENVGVSPHTAYSVPAIFSGKIYDGSVPGSNYFKESIQKGFQNRLYEAGYEVNLIPAVSMRDGQYSNYYEIPHAYNAEEQALLLSDGLRLFEVVLFRQSPHFLRKVIYDENNWLLRGFLSTPDADNPPPEAVSFHHKAFFRDYIRGVSTGDERPSYHFLHFHPPHPPYLTREDGRYAGRVLSNTRKHYKNEARHVLRIFIELLDKLRVLGIYDSSLIILQGDHGSMIRPVIDGQTVVAGPERTAALLVVKPPSDTSPFKVSRAQTSLSDVPATVMDLLGMDHPYPGVPLFSNTSATPRKRHFIMVLSSQIKHYSVTGSIFSPASWSTGEGEQLVRQQANYAFGTEITFGIVGNAGPFTREGWSIDTMHSWSNGELSQLHFQIGPPVQDLVLEARYFPYVHPPQVPRQRIRVAANGVQVAEWTADAKKKHISRAVIPRDLVQSPNLNISFSFPDSVVPKEIGTGSDTRQLSIALSKVTIDQRQTTDYLFGRELSFGGLGNAGPFIGRGWSIDSAHSWSSNGDRARLHFQIVPPSQDLVLEAHYVPYVYPPQVPRQRIRVMANGVQVAEWLANEKRRYISQAVIPRDVLQSPNLTLSFYFPDNVAPEEIGTGAETRWLGIALLKATLSLAGLPDEPVGRH